MKKIYFLLALILIIAMAFVIYIITNNNTNEFYIIMNNTNELELIPDNLENVNVNESLVPKNVIINTDGTKENKSPEVTTPVVLEEFELKDISLKYDNGLTDFSATVVNNSDVDYNYGAEFNVYFYDDAGKTMVTIPVITSTLKSKGESYINSKITMDCSNASSIKVEIVK